jgi:hypothetical protein
MAVAGLACGLCVGIRKGDLWIGAMGFGWESINALTLGWLKRPHDSTEGTAVRKRAAKAEGMTGGTATFVKKLEASRFIGVLRAWRGYCWQLMTNTA